MATFDGLGRRRQPVQERSRKRVERILAAARQLLEAGGADAVTTRAIAERAHIPVATVYQFFPNRDAIVEEILHDLLDRRDAEGAAALAGLHPASLDDVVHTIFEFHRTYLDAQPQMVALFYTSRSSGALADPRQRRARFADALHHALIEWRLIDADTSPQVTMLAVELGDHLLELAHRAGPGPDRVILAEGERALAAYLRTYAPG